MIKAPKKTDTICEKMQNGRYFECSIGNTKIPTTTLIFNMGSATHCPADKRGLCPFGKKHGDGTCYALKAECLRKKVLPFRQRQETTWVNSSASDLTNIIRKIISRRKYINCIRVNESGDFHNINCVIKLSRIADSLDVPVYTYTHRSDLFTPSVIKSLSRNLSVNFSTDMEYKHNHNEFRLPEDIPNGIKTFECKGDCSVCSLCVKPRGIIITNARH